MRRILATMTTAVAVGIPLAVLPAGPAAAIDFTCGADRFCAFRHATYGDRILEAAAGRGAQVGVEGNETSSARNRRNNIWFGRDGRGPLPDVTVFTFGPQSDVPYVGSGANDRIDYFIVD